VVRGMCPGADDDPSRRSPEWLAMVKGDGGEKPLLEPLCQTYRDTSRVGTVAVQLKHMNRYVGPVVSNAQIKKRDGTKHELWKWLRRVGMYSSEVAHRPSLRLDQLPNDIRIFQRM
jgi:hypothetical protein